jgi:hypothetical protein
MSLPKCGWPFDRRHRVGRAERRLQRAFQAAQRPRDARKPARLSQAVATGEGHQAATGAGEKQGNE